MTLKSFKCCFGIFLLVLVLLLNACGQKIPTTDGIAVTPEILASVSMSLAAQVDDSTTNADAQTSTMTTNYAEVSAMDTVCHATSITSEPVAVDSVQSIASAQTTETEMIAETEQTMSSQVVYWTESGSVYHISNQCSTLHRSRNILYGSVEDALAAKKERVCKTCSKSLSE